jgi:hypothetical protein
MLSLLSNGYYGGADNISHYFISHYAFKYPLLFLDSWGRPLYTIVSAPFAQFGFQGAKLLNVLLGISTAYFTYRIAQLLNIKPSVAALIFVCFTPLYFIMMPTVLTEILFSFVIILSVFQFLKGRYIVSAIVISFLPFARTEGYVLLPLFMAALIWAGKPKVIPFLATGILFFSMIGAICFDDFFWLVNRFPYPVTYRHPTYNKPGELWHFLQARDYILGLPLEILFVAGIAGMFRDLFSKEQSIRKNAWLLCVVVLIPFLVYFAFHSFLYWKAMGGSMGLERVMAAVIPLAALISLKGFCDLGAIFRPSRFLYPTFIILILATVIIKPFRMYKTPFPLSPEEETINRATKWLKASPYAKKGFYFTDNNVPFCLGVNPYDDNQVGHRYPGGCMSLDTLPPGSLLIWDAHFGANESNVPVDSLLNNHTQKVISYFKPHKPWITFGGSLYECYITLTMNPGEVADNYAIRDSLQTVLDEKEFAKLLYHNTFETPVEVLDPSYYSSDTMHSGKMSFRMDNRIEFSPGISQPASTLSLTGDKQGLRVSLYVNMAHVDPQKIILLVISFERDKKPYSYTPINLNDLKIRTGKWNRVALEASVPSSLLPQDVVKSYLWNPYKQVLYIDDFNIYLTN